MKNKAIEVVTMEVGEELREVPVTVKGRGIQGDYSTSYGPGRNTRGSRQHNNKVERGR